MESKAPNEGLRRIVNESRWSQAQFAMAVNRVRAEAGVLLWYDESAVSHWMSGTRPRKTVRPFIHEALSRRSADRSLWPRSDWIPRRKTPTRIPWKD